MRGSRQPLAHEYRVAHAFHAPVWDGVECRSTQGFASAETEAGVVQWTPKRVLDNEPPTEWPTVVRTGCADGEEFCAAACEDHMLTTNLSLNHSSLWNAIDCHSTHEIRSNIPRHVSVLRNDDAAEAIFRRLSPA